VSDRPNILLVVTDSAQQSAYGCYGNALVRTPAMDALAREGVCFTQAYTAAPICHPSRASIDTGLFPHRHGLLDNIHTPDAYPYRIVPQARSYVDLLAELGYRTGYTGQWHVRQDRFDDVIAGGWTAFRATGLSESPRADRPHHRYFGELAISPDQDRDAYSVRGAVELLRRYARLGRPWLLQCEFDRPHPPVCIPPPYAGLYDPDIVPPPGNFHDPAVGKGAVHLRARAEQLPGPFGDTWRQLIAHYWGCITMLDDYLARILEELDRLHLREQTVVIVTSDHGELMGAHGVVTKYPMMYDEVVRVPLVARGPGHLPAGQRRDDFVSHVDLLPSLMDLAGGGIPRGVHGRSWAGPTGNTAPPRHSIYAQLHGHTMRMVRTRGWKYVYGPDAEEELYDLALDPGEVHNRASTAPAQLAEMRRLLREWTVAVGDSVASPSSSEPSG
jgi:arylsulfatase A-like enzyme